MRVLDGGIGTHDGRPQAARAHVDDEQRSAVRHDDDPSRALRRSAIKPPTMPSDGHEQQIEDVHDGRSQLVVADDADDDGDGLRRAVRDHGRRGAVGQR